VCYQAATSLTRLVGGELRCLPRCDGPATPPARLSTPDTLPAGGRGRTTAPKGTSANSRRNTPIALVRWAGVGLGFHRDGKASREPPPTGLGSVRRSRPGLEASRHPEVWRAPVVDPAAQRAGTTGKEASAPRCGEQVLSKSPQGRRPSRATLRSRSNARRADCLRVRGSRHSLEGLLSGPTATKR
jgi:hypothetical protein